MAYEAQYVHGDQLKVDYTPGSAVAAGEVVVQGDLVGVALLAIAASALGALCLTGVFDFAKGSGAIDAGAKLYWDDTANQATATADSNKYLGKCVKAAADGDSTVRAALSIG